jgi:hypothetical protein
MIKDQLEELLSASGLSKRELELACVIVLPSSYPSEDHAGPANYARLCTRQTRLNGEMSLSSSQP